MAGEFMGHVQQERIRQIGESLERVAQDFQVIDAFRHLKTGA
jgi:hypothetical protein